MVWNGEDVVRLRDVRPTLDDLLGHRPLKTGPMVGVDHCLLMSSYQLFLGILSADQKKLFLTDAILPRNL